MVAIFFAPTYFFLCIKFFIQSMFSSSPKFKRKRFERNTSPIIRSLHIVFSIKSGFVVFYNIFKLSIVSDCFEEMAKEFFLLIYY